MGSHLNSRAYLSAVSIAAAAILVSSVVVAGGAAASNVDGSAPSPTPVECGQPGFSSLEPQPLDEPTEVTMTAAAQLEAFAPAFVAAATGEFEKENLDVEIVVSQTAVQALATGEADASLSAPSLEMINAVRQDVDLRWITGNYYPDPESLIGIYSRADLVGDELDWTQLVGQKVSLTNPSGLTLVTLNNRLREKGLSLADVDVVRMAPADALIALENGALGAAWLNAPIHLEVADNPEFVFVGGQDPDFVGGGVIAGPSLLDGEHCEVITALVRAMERAIQANLMPGYKANPEAVALLAEVLEIPEESITGNEELIFTQRIPENVMTEFQDSLIEFGLMPDSDRVPEEDLVDRSYLESIDGAN